LPSANAVMTSVLLRLERLTGDARYASLAGKTQAALANDMGTRDTKDDPRPDKAQRR
jgi:uncharacterized protein YyaL (SSP411 family)